MEEQQFYSKPAQRKNFIQRNPLSVKIVLIGILIALLIIPVSMIQGLIYERESTATEAVNEVHQKWSSYQKIVGPVLTIPYYEKVEKSGDGEKDQKIKKVKNYLHFLPETLSIEGELKTEELKRGLYEIVVYNAPLELKGQFVFPKEFSGSISSEDLLIEDATLNIGITDLRGISEQIEIKWGNDTLLFNPGIDGQHFLGSGVSTPINMASLTDSPDHSLNFNIKLHLKGSESIRFAPLGQTTSVTLNSNSTTPSFTGSFLPAQREVSDSGFKSNWKVLHLNRNYSQVLAGNAWESTISESAFGVDLLMPVQQYQKSMRSVKYAFLIIILTFVVSFFVEVLQKKNIHPFQYLLTGLALCLFYTLLIAISEHLNFTLSYFIAAAMTTVLLTIYMAGILKIRKTAFTIGGLLAFLYIYIFVLIQMETYALLAGSIGLFIILAVIMYYSQKINWNSNEQ